MNIISMNDYDKVREKALKKIKGAGEDELFSSILKANDSKTSLDRDANEEAIRMVVNKCLEEYREGEYSFDETVKMLCGALSKL